MGESEEPPTKRSRVDNSTNENDDKKHHGLIKDQSVKNGESKYIDSRTSVKVDQVNIKTPASSSSVLNIISPEALSSVNATLNSYKKAKPFAHGVVENLFVDGFLESVLDEIKQNSKVKFKESDLFRVYQSIDLGNLQNDENDDGGKGVTKKDSQCKKANTKLMPNLMKLRKMLYSPQYRAYMEQLSDLEPGTLTDEIDCAANCHAKGCHLLCHDDVIGTRKISYILYLTDPEPEWTDGDGGRLELYESTVLEEKKTILNDDDINDSGKMSCGDLVTKRRIPGVFPSKTILPRFNSMAYFIVEPGVSFHSVQEVFCERPRLSIQGWYHANVIPSKVENATLNRLKSTEEGEDTEGKFTPFESYDCSRDNAIPVTSNASFLSAEDKEALSPYINKTYLEDKSIGEIRQRFEEESSVQLRQFFNEEWSKKIKNATSREDDRQCVGKDRASLDYKVGVNDDWKAVGPAHKQRFLEYVGNSYNGKKDGDKKHHTPGSLLLHLKQAVFLSHAFRRLLKNFTSLGIPLGYRGKVRRFRPGLDYTVAHYGILTKEPVLDATMCFVAGTGQQCKYDPETGDLMGEDDDAAWESGEIGGFECYISADDDNDGNEEPADEYNDEDDTELLSVSASDNTLSLVYRDPGTMRFVKYISSRAPSSRWDISLEYEVEDEEDDEGGEKVK